MPVQSTPPLHARVVAIALQRSTVGQSPPPLGFHLLLELLKELLVETGQRVDDPEARATLGGLPSSGKTGRLVRDLLALEAKNGFSNHDDALARHASIAASDG